MFEDILLKIKAIELEHKCLMDRLEKANNKLVKIRHMAYKVAEIETQEDPAQLVRECLHIDTF